MSNVVATKRYDIIRVIVFDHFTSENKEETECLAEFIGQFVSENEFYLKIRSAKADLNNINSAGDYHNIFKPAIKEQWIYEENSKKQ